MKQGVDYIGMAVSFRCHDGKGNYLMHLRGKGCRDEHHCWDFGGGGVEFGEKLEEALHREVREEYGAEVLKYKLLGHREALRTKNGTRTHWVRFAYKVLVDPKQVINNEPEKHDEIGWFSSDNLPTPLHSQIATALKQNPL